ncbi:MAG: glycosyltransferase [Ruminococcus sp.]|nr:glycosyltransferase [Ruminococcus sp.]
MAKVSVIVPVYNAEQFIAKTIENLLSQTLDDMEIILVNDGSTDKSGEICDNYADKNSKITVIHQKNGGVCKARNAGISASTGEYIGFCDADDVPDNDLYEYLYDLATQNNCDISIADTYILSEDGSKEFRSDDFSFSSRNREEFIREFLDGRFGDAIYTNLYKGDICRTVKFEEGRKINEDKMFFFDFLMKAESVSYRSVGKYGYYRHMGSASLSAFSDNFFDYLYFMEKISAICREEYPQLEEYIKKNELTTYLTLLTLMCTLNARKSYSEQFKKIAKKGRSYKLSFCKKHLPQKTFIKWLCLKMGNFAFDVSIKAFASL